MSVAYTEMTHDERQSIADRLIENGYKAWREKLTIDYLKLHSVIDDLYGVGSCVFGIWQGDICVYVGSTQNIWNYIGTIRRAMKKPRTDVQKYIASNGGISAFRFKKFGKGDVPHYLSENYHIAKYRPHLNQSKHSHAYEEVMKYCQADTWYYENIINDICEKNICEKELKDTQHK